jgi:hypothetical protein
VHHPPPALYGPQLRQDDVLLRSGADPERGVIRGDHQESGGPRHVRPDEIGEGVLETDDGGKLSGWDAHPSGTGSGRKILAHPLHVGNPVEQASERHVLAERQQVVLRVPGHHLDVRRVQKVLVQEPSITRLRDGPHERVDSDRADGGLHGQPQDGVPGGVSVESVLRPHGEVGRIRPQLEVQPSVVPGHDVVPDDPALRADLHGDVPLDHGHIQRRALGPGERYGHGGHGQTGRRAERHQGPGPLTEPERRGEQQRVDGRHDQPEPDGSHDRQQRGEKAIVVLSGPQPQPHPSPEWPHAPEPLHRRPRRPHDQGRAEGTIVPPHDRDHRPEQAQEDGDPEDQRRPAQDGDRDQPGQQEPVEGQSVDHPEERSPARSDPSERPEQGNQ